ncbi:MAG: nucleotidyltransferase domain-containing protein [Anaerolineae bacterium]|nr:nucleotidyltransferase domain-containing protein [Anaerolineae bacterium]
MPIDLLPHHRQTIDHITNHFRADPRYRALLIGGSIVKGLARPDSDVDVMLITTDEEYTRLSQERDFTFYRPELSTYEGGYVDGKFLNHQFLLDAAQRGSEPTRWSFKNAIVAYSDIPDLEDTLQQIAQYQLHEQEAKIRSFYGQLFIMHWFVREAEKRHNTYLLTRVTADLVLFGSRLILAHNRMLFPFHKWMMTEVERAPEKPEGFIELANTLLQNPTSETAKTFFETITNFRDWGVSIREAVNHFTEDSERYWLHGRPALSDW